MSERRTRVEQSIRLICDALWSLMEKKAFSEISISEVCQTATVSRNTFYRRFRGPEDVLDYYLEKEASDILTQYSILEHFDKRNPSAPDGELSVGGGIVCSEKHSHCWSRCS